MAYNWNWEVFLQPSATGEGTYLTWLLEGLKWTVTLSLSSWMIALIVGSVIGVLRTVRLAVPRRARSDPGVRGQPDDRAWLGG